MKLLLWYLPGYPLSVILISGMLYSHYYFNYFNSALPQRVKIGQAIVWGMWLAAPWPITLPMVWCWTGFARNGIWRSR